MKWKERALFIFVCVFLLCILHYQKSNNIIDDEDNVYENSKRSIPSSKEKADMPFHPWDIWAEMPNKRAITSASDLQVNLILNAMSKSKIVKVGIGYKGTQLKAQFKLSGPTLQDVVFKPKRYPRDKILDKTPYEGYDRHNGEIAAFHLDRILGFYRAPPVVGRLVNFRDEIIPFVYDKLRDTIWKDNGGNFCFYGKCYYCNLKESACGNGNIMESSLTLWLPTKWKLFKMRHPWQRTYKKDKLARWEVDANFCNIVIQKPPYNKGPRLLDLIDASIFDFLIGNADRHHYEFIKDDKTSMVVHLDNGKSFGDPFHDELSILAPLLQCCTLRHSTFISISSFMSDGDKSLSLSNRLEEKLKKDPIYPVLTNDHLKAVDRRLEIILEKLNECFKMKGRDNVLIKEDNK